jgi:hypothetical protein
MAGVSLAGAGGSVKEVPGATAEVQRRHRGIPQAKGGDTAETFAIKIDKLAIPSGLNRQSSFGSGGKVALQSDLLAAFHKYKSVVSVKVVVVNSRRDGDQRCFAFVNFADRSEQQAAFESGAETQLRQSQLDVFQSCTFVEP